MFGVSVTISDLHQDRRTKGTSDTGKPIRRTRTKTYSTQQVTDKRNGKSKTISAIRTDKQRSSTDISIRMVLSEQAQLREVNPPAPLPDESKQSQNDDDRDKKGEATVSHNTICSDYKFCTKVLCLESLSV